MIVQRQSKKGKIFYSCSNYPKCKFALWDKPVNVTCPKCAYPLMVEKFNKTKGSYLYCPSCKFKKAEIEVQ
jgi:DNA topoisomerase-1